MENNLTTLEEFDIERKMQFPHLVYPKISSVTKKKVSLDVLSRDNEELLSISPLGFSDPSVVAGLTEKHIEYFAKNGPREHKENLMKVFSEQAVFDETVDIIKFMDEDQGINSSINRDRFKKVSRYVQDNWILFQF